MSLLKLNNNSKAKDKGNHAPWRVWKSDEKLLVFASLISPSKSVCLRSYIEHSSQCFITISKPSKFVKNTPLRVVFSTLFSVFDMPVMKHCVSCLICLVPHNNELVKQGSEHYYRSDTLQMSGWNNGFFSNGFPFFTMKIKAKACIALTRQLKRI